MQVIKYPNLKKIMTLPEVSRENEVKRVQNENIEFRYKLLKALDGDIPKQAAIFDMCKEDPLFFINSFVWTFNPRLTPSTLPFVTYPYQDKYIEDLIIDIELGQDNCTEKSRDMGFSWVIVAIIARGYLFHNWSVLYGSYKESYVDKQGDMDSFFERVRFVMEKIPRFLKPEDHFDKFMNISSQKNSSAISGDAGQNFGTGGRRKVVIMDEFALWQHDQKAFRKTKDVTNCRIIGGTPEGSYNIYGKIMTNHKDYSHLNIKKYRLHWTQHPLKTNEWYEEEKMQRTKLDVAKELDISYDASVTGAVYKHFTTYATFGNYEYEDNPNRKLYTSWDFGRDMVSIIWYQKDFSTGAVYIIDAFQKSDTDIDFFAAFIKGEPINPFTYDEFEDEVIERHKLFKNRYANHYGDPYNADSRNVLSTNTIKKQLKGYGINLQTKRGSTVEERITKTELGMRRLFVNEKLTGFIQAIIQSRYPEVKENSQQTKEKTLPVHDENSHFRTSLEYFFDNEPMKTAGGSMLVRKTK